MKTQEKILKAFNLKVEKHSVDNVYVPIKKTIRPKVRLSFNETMQYLRKELILIKKR